MSCEAGGVKLHTVLTLGSFGLMEKVTPSRLLPIHGLSTSLTSDFCSWPHFRPQHPSPFSHLWLTTLLLGAMADPVLLEREILTRLQYFWLHYALLGRRKLRRFPVFLQPQYDPGPMVYKIANSCCDHGLPRPQGPGGNRPRGTWRKSS